MINNLAKLEDAAALPNPFEGTEIRLYTGLAPATIAGPLDLVTPPVTLQQRLAAMVATAKLAVLRRLRPEWFGCEDGEYWRPAHPRVEHLEKMVSQVNRQPKHRMLSALFWDRRRELYVGKAAAGTPTFLRIFDAQGRVLVQYTPAGPHEFPVATHDGQDVAMEFHFTTALG